MPELQFKTQMPNPNLPEVLDITPEEIFALRAHPDLQLVDVREREEFTGDLGHIEGAELLPLLTLPDVFQKLNAKKTTVFICRSGGRSGKACDFARRMGLTQVFNMQGGMIHWNELQFPVSKEPPQGPNSR